jgi:hypothetical protein
MIINFTQHPSTPEQRAAGVVDLPAEERARLQELLTFEELPAASDIRARALTIADLAATKKNYPHPCVVMIGGAPFLMAALERALQQTHIIYCYAFSRRESAETIRDDGSVHKTQIFRHAGFVYPDASN